MLPEIFKRNQAASEGGQTHSAEAHLKKPGFNGLRAGIAPNKFFGQIRARLAQAKRTVYCRLPKIWRRFGELYVR